MTPSRTSWALFRPLGLAVAVLLTAVAAWGQTTWTKYPGNPVLPLGKTPPWGGAEWDAGIAGIPVVLFDGTTYRMWYTGGAANDWEAFGYATSPDGVTWTKYPGNPVLRRGPAGAWDAQEMWPIAIVFDGATYHLWYSAMGSVGQRVERTGYATSPDGITWAKCPANPILPAGPPGSWDDVGAVIGGVLLEGGTFRGWYTGARVAGQGFGAMSVGYATSSDGVNWAKWPEPVLESSASGWDTSINVGPVVFDGTAYHLWYTDFGSVVQIGHAVSTDGMHWTKQPAEGPVLRPGGGSTFDIGGVAFPSVLLVGDKAQMWYAGAPWGDSMHLRVGYATAPLPFPDPPAADFTWNPASPSPGQTVYFTDQSTNTPTSWAWAFGDGATSTDQNPTRVFPAAGTYTVTLTAINALGPSDQVAHSITVGQLHVIRRRLRHAASWSVDPRGFCQSSLAAPGQGRPPS